MQNSMNDVHFFCFRPEIPFLGNLVQKIKVISLSLDLIQYAEFNGDIHFVYFQPEILFFEQIKSEKSNLSV